MEQNANTGQWSSQAIKKYSRKTENDTTIVPYCMVVASFYVYNYDSKKQSFAYRCREFCSLRIIGLSLFTSGWCGLRGCQGTFSTGKDKESSYKCNSFWIHYYENVFLPVSHFNTALNSKISWFLNRNRTCPATSTCFSSQIPMWFWILFQKRWRKVAKPGINLQYLAKKQAKNDIFLAFRTFDFLRILHTSVGYETVDVRTFLCRKSLSKARIFTFQFEFRAKWLQGQS